MSDEKLLKPAELVPFVLQAVLENGELGTDEVVKMVQQDEPTATDQAVTRAITLLDRQGKLTRANQDAGWQITANGRDSMQQIESKAISAYIAPYDRFETVVAEMELISPSLGPITGPGGSGKSTFPRLPNDEIVLYGGWVRAALEKAMDRMVSIVATDLTGKPKKTPDAAWGRVTLWPVILPADTPLGEKVRRPVNNRNMAVGEIIHEALLPGTILRIEAEFPLSHFPEPIIRRIFNLAAAVGISPAGSGKGGIWGVARLRSLTIGGRNALAA